MLAEHRVTSVHSGDDAFVFASWTGRPLTQRNAMRALTGSAAAEEVAWQLGHRNSVVTRSVYVQEIRTAEPSRQRRAQLAKRYRALRLAGLNGGARPANERGSERAEAELKRLDPVCGGSRVWGRPAGVYAYYS